jgi:CRISPR system Cascade subunit CasA
MELHFNLVDEPWLPCIRADGTPVELSLYDALAQAHTLRELHGENPLDTAALHRLLLAILHRNFGPANRSAWSRLWKRGRWEVQPLHDYFDRWHSRFDLFDADHPFFQAADDRVRPKSVTSMIHHMASGNNPTLFDHHTDDAEVILTPARAARLLVCAQAFGLAGLSGLMQKFTDGSCARGIVFLVRGTTLFETLALNLVRYTDQSPIPGQLSDCPAWEMDGPCQPERRVPLGYLDYLTWQNRRILLVPDRVGAEVVVRRMSMAPGLRLESSVLDPMSHYRHDEQRGPLPLSFTEGRALWRDSAALFQLRDSVQHPPRTFLWIADLVDEECLDASLTRSYLALGMSKKQAKVFFVRQEEMPLPMEYLADESLAENLRDGLQVAEEVGTALRRAGLLLAQWMVSPGDNQNAHRENTQLVFSRLGVEARYWSRLEVPFREFVRDLPTDRQAAFHGWIRILLTTARQAFQESVDGVGELRRSLKATTLARRTLEYWLARAVNKE